ncbi:hypothetical protein HPCPY1124_0309 [Helicobacter pylori CPY1124]|nr:hypothetical protein HPCPY1124_0309 [Helicobacter pylori CPY1124]
MRGCCGRYLNTFSLLDLKRLFEGFLSLFISLITFFAIKLILGSIVKQE